MNGVDILTIIGIVGVITAASLYLRNFRNKGGKCVGCPYSAECNEKHCNDKKLSEEKN